MHVIFSQVPTPHSRIGNSLFWMSRAQTWLDRTPCEADFPWARERFSDFLSDESCWVKPKPAVEARFRSLFGIELSAASATEQCRRAERAWVQSRGGAARQWDELMLHPDLASGTLFVMGRPNLDSQAVRDEMAGHDLVILHEPFRFDYASLGDEEVGTFHSLSPRAALIEQCRCALGPASGRERVGIHVRRGDFARWQGGRYYFDDEFWIRLVQAQIDPAADVMVFSNDLSESLGSALQAHGATVSRDEFSQDLVKMMWMDRLVGPPSSFTVMATHLSASVLGRRVQLTTLPPKS